MKDKKFIFKCDCDRYPLPETLRKISKWDGNPITLLEAIKDNWAYGNFKSNDDKTHYVMYTNGWSGNESIIDALHKNKLFSSIFWFKSMRGGLTEYKIPEFYSKEYFEKG